MYACMYMCTCVGKYVRSYYFCHMKVAQCYKALHQTGWLASTQIMYWRKFHPPYDTKVRLLEKFNKWL